MLRKYKIAPIFTLGDKMKPEIKWKEYTEIDMKPKEFVKFVAPKIGKEQPFEDVKAFRDRGYLTFEEFLKLALCKSPRPKPHYLKNKPKDVENITRKAFEQKKLDDIILTLTELEGVGIPVASYILTAWNPMDYGTYDIRMQKILPECEGFKEPEKKSNDLEWYKAELHLLRKWKKELGIKTCRQIEYALWRFQQMKGDRDEIHKTKINI